MSDIFATGLLKEKIEQQQMGAHVEEEEKKQIDRFLTRYMPGEKDLNYRSVKDTERNFELLERCRSIQKEKQISDTASGTAMQPMESTELTWKEQKEREKNLEEARKHIPGADFSTYEGAKALEKIRDERSEAGITDFNFAKLGEAEKKQVIDELIQIDLTESMLTESYVMSHVAELCKYSKNLTAVRNYFISEEGRDSLFDENLDELERGVINSRIISIAVPFQKHLSNILLRNGLSLENMTYIDLKDMSEDSDGYKYTHTDMVGEVISSYNELAEVLQTQKTTESVFFEDNLGATIHSLTKEQIEGMKETNPARYQLVKEYLDAEERELLRRRQPGTGIDQASETEAEDREKREMIIRRKRFLRTGNIAGKQDKKDKDKDKEKDHRENWALSDYGDLIWEQYKDKYSDDDNAFFAAMETLNTRVLTNHAIIETLIKSAEGQRLTMGLPYMEEKLRDALKAEKKEIYSLEEDAYKSKATETMTKTSLGTEEEKQTWQKRYDDLKEILPESCFNVEGGTRLVGKLVLEKDPAIYEKKVKALRRRKENNEKLLAETLEKQISPLSRDLFMGDLKKYLDYRIVLFGQRDFVASIRTALKNPLFYAPDGAYMEADFREALASFDLPMEAAYQDPMAKILLANAGKWQSEEHGDKRIKAMKALIKTAAEDLKKKKKLEEVQKKDKVETGSEPESAAKKEKTAEEKRLQRTRMLAVFTEEVKEGDREIFYQYRRVEGKDTWFGNGRFELTERERRLRYARKAWEILEERGHAAECAKFFNSMHNDHLPELHGNSKIATRQEAREKILSAISEVLKEGAVNLPGYMESGKLKDTDLFHEMRLMGLDAELLSDGAEGAETFLKYDSKVYAAGLDSMGEKYRDRYVDLEETLQLTVLHLTDEQKKTYRKRLHKEMCSMNDDDWKLLMANFSDYVKSTRGKTEEKKKLATEAADLHLRIETRQRTLEEFDGGKLKPVIDRLKKDPEVWKNIVDTQDDEAFDLYVEKLNSTVGVLMDALRKSRIPDFVAEQYLAAHFDVDMRELKTWDAGIDKIKSSEEDLEKLRNKKVDKLSGVMRDFLTNDFMGYKITGRGSIEEHIDKIWGKKHVQKKADEKKSDGMDPMTYVSLLFKEEGASFKMLYKEGTLEREIKAIRAKQAAYAPELEKALKKAKIPAGIAGMSMAELPVSYEQYTFIHAKELPEIKGSDEAAKKKRQAAADKLAADFYAEISRIHQEEEKQERKSEKILKEEREFARHVAGQKQRGKKLYEETFSMGKTAEDFGKLMQSRSVLIAGTDTHLDNKTSELEKHRKALDEMVGQEETDPFIFNCLLEKYQGLKHSERKNDSKKTIEAEILDDRRFLTKLRTFSQNSEYPPEKQDAFIAWFYRHTNPGSRFLKEETGTDSDFLDSELFNKELPVFEQGYAALHSLDSLKVNDPVIQREQVEYTARMKMLFFTTGSEEGTMPALAATLKRERQFLFLEDVMASLYDKCLKEYAKNERADFGRLKTGLRDYFRGQLINTVLENEDAATFDLNKFKKDQEAEINKLIEDSGKRQYLFNETGTRGSEDVYGEQKAFEGQKTSSDLDKVIREAEGPWDKKAYNQLLPQERMLFALALTVTSEGGSTLYDGTAAMLKSEEERGRVLDSVTAAASAYMEGKPIETFIDYDLAIRRLLKDKTGTKDHDVYNTDVFDEAMQFTKLLMDHKKEEEAKQSVDKKVLSDGNTSIIAANRVAGKQQATFLEQNDIHTVEGFRQALERELNDPNAKVSTEIKERFNKLVAEDELWKLIDVLQDRNILDFSDSQKSEEGAEKKVIGHVDDEKRLVVRERIMDEMGTPALRRRSERSAHVKKAMLSVLSFQLKDNTNFAGRAITKKDFSDGALSRKTLFDWKLISRGLDMLDEIEGETVKRRAIEGDFIRKVGNKESVKALDSLETFETKKKEYGTDIFTAQLSAFANKDFADGSDGEERAAMMAGFYSLNEQEKALFFRALEHRDVLDISKVNLYWNIVGRGDRDFVNPEGRNSLIDEFMASTRGKNAKMSMGPATVYNAMHSLLSTQIDDSMDFLKEKKDLKDFTAGERMYLFQRETAIDWKLFARALQLVHRARTEMEMNRGDIELHRTMGDIAETGRVSMDSTFMRMNIHRTGGRFLRFVGKEIGDEVASKVDLGSLQGIAAKVLSTETMNRINGLLTHLEFEKEEEEEEEEDEEDEEEEEEEEDKSFIKEMTALFFTARGAVNDIKEELEPLTEEEEEKPALETILAEYGIEKPETWKEKFLSGLDSALDKLEEFPDQKEKADKKVNAEETQEMMAKILGQRITSFLTEVYNSKSEMVDKKIDDLAEHIDSLLEWIPESTRNKLMSVGESFGGFWEDYGDTVTGYVKDGVKSAIAIKNIISSAGNIKELKEAKGQMAEDAVKDDEAYADHARAQTAEQKALYDKARSRNSRLAALATDFSVSRESEDIVVSSGQILGTAVKITADIVAPGMEVAGEVLEEIVNQAAKLTAFIHHCIADHEGMETYYGGPGSEEAEEVRQNMSSISGLKSKLDGVSNAKLVRMSRGYESEEELVNFTALEMVHSLVFSASDFNPLEETKRVSRCVMAVLGLKDLIGKTDKETAMKVYGRLTR